MILEKLLTNQNGMNGMRIYVSINFLKMSNIGFMCFMGVHNEYNITYN